MALARFSTCELSDALIKLNVAHGGHISGVISMFPSKQPVCGPAYTVRMVLGPDKAAPPKPSTHFIDAAPKGCIAVIDVPRQAKNAVWGGLMSAGAIVRGVQGVVISGRCRDLGELRAAGLPVFARGQSTLGQSPFTRPAELNIPLAIEAGDDFPPVTINPGDLVVADEDGVVCVPKDLVERVEEVAQRGRDTDEKCMEDIKAGMSIQETFKKWRG